MSAAIDSSDSDGPTAPRITTVRSHACLLGTSAVLLAAAFPKPGWGLLAHVALVPMGLAAIRSASPWRLAWSGYLIGFVWWLVRIGWLAPVTVGGTVVLSAYLGIYLPTALVIIHAVRRRWPVAMTFLLPTVWVSLELVRAFYPAGGFNWAVAGSHPSTAYRHRYRRSFGTDRRSVR